MEDVLEIRRDRVMARNTLRAEARLLNWHPQCHTGALASQEMWCFWYTSSEELEGAVLPDAVVRGLRSQAAISQIVVKLLTYQSFTNIPPGVEPVDATMYMAKEPFEQKLRNGVRIAHMADLLRMRAIAQSNKTLAWLWDAECLLLQPIYGAKSAQWGLGSESFGFAFASLPAAPGCMGGRAATEIRWAKNGLCKPKDRRYFTTPVRVVVNSELCRQLLWAVEEFVSSASSQKPLDYNCVMKEWQRLFLAKGLEDACLPICMASGINPWSKGKPLQMRHSNDFPWRDIAALSLCVNNYWQSGKLGDRSPVRRGVETCVEPESAWWHIMQRVDDLCREAAGQTVQVHCASLASASSFQWPPMPAWSDMRVFEAMRLHFQGLDDLQNRWTLVAEIGVGSFGFVYHAKSNPPAICQSAAVKVMTCESGSYVPSSYHSEALIMHKVASERVVKLLDAWIAPTMTVLVRCSVVSVKQLAITCFRVVKS